MERTLVIKLKFMKYDEVIISLLEESEKLKNEGQWERSIKILQKILMDCPDCVEAYEELGDNYLALRKIKEARKALAMAIKINPRSSNAHYLFGFLFSIEENWNKSVLELEKADEIAPHHPEILRCLGWAVYNSNRQNQGISILERSRNLNPIDLNILCDLGVCYMNSLQHKKAEDVFKEALKINPNSEQARECLKVLEVIRKSKNMDSSSRNNTDLI